MKTASTLAVAAAVLVCAAPARAQLTLDPGQTTLSSPAVSSGAVTGSGLGVYGASFWTGIEDTRLESFTLYLESSARLQKGFRMGVAEVDAGGTARALAFSGPGPVSGTGIVPFTASGAWVPAAGGSPLPALVLPSTRQFVLFAVMLGGTQVSFGGAAGGMWSAPMPASGNPADITLSPPAPFPAKTQLALAFDATFAPAVVTPEPSTVVLLATGLLGLGAAARRRRSALVTQDGDDAPAA